MYHNCKLKHAVTVALSLIAFGFHHSSNALALGDINDTSHLDQSLITTTENTQANNTKNTIIVRKADTNVETSATELAMPTQTQMRLSISTSNNFSTQGSTTAGLRLDKQLSFQPIANYAIVTKNIAVEDEITAMNKRLKHLQKQISTLEEKNLKLESENKLRSEQLPQTGTFQTKLMNTLPFIGTGLLLVVSYIGFTWLRRRQLKLKEYNTKAIWLNTSKQDNELESHTLKMSNSDNIFADLDFGIEDTDTDEKLSPSRMPENFDATKTEEESIVFEDEQQISVLDHADVFLSHGRSALAIQLLQSHLSAHPKQSVTIWLFLLDLLAKDNLQSLYEQTAQDCKLHYNVKITEFSKPETTSTESLEDFPRLAQGLESVWNTPAAIVYLEDLIYNNRLEPRAGLPKNLIEELVLLRSIAQVSVNTAEVIQLNEKKLAIIEQKEALLGTKKTEQNATIFEFTLTEKNN
jgi:predicted DNA-binding protein YlxM (UPF0122 family)